jgi:hypothetical protein
MSFKGLRIRLPWNSCPKAGNAATEITIRSRQHVYLVLVTEQAFYPHRIWQAARNMGLNPPLIGLGGGNDSVQFPCGTAPWNLPNMQ